MKKIIQFFKEAQAEFKKVSWPSWEELWQSTMVVIVVSIVIASFIGVVDIVLSKAVALVLG